MARQRKAERAEKRISWRLCRLLPLLFWGSLCVSGLAACHSGQVAYYGQVEVVLQDWCTSCHTEGGLGPFQLDSYEQAQAQADALVTATADRTMPPWPPSAECQPLESPRTLTDEQIALIADWANAGSWAGHSADHREQPPAPDSGLGAPQISLVPDAPYTPSATEDEYRCFPIDLGLEQDTFLVAGDIIPGNDAIVHHVVLYESSTDPALSLDEQDAAPGYSCFGGAGVEANDLIAWVPGAGAVIFPAGTGLLLHAGSLLIMQVHYHPRGTPPDPDLTEAALYLSDDPSIQAANIIRIANESFTIPAGATNYPVTWSKTLIESGLLWRAGGHMHLLGVSVTMEHQSGTGDSSCLLNIPNWNYDWQGSYQFAESFPVKVDDAVRLTCIFDNSADNPNNPSSPPVDVSWGETTTDEMCVGTLYFVPERPL